MISDVNCVLPANRSVNVCYMEVIECGSCVSLRHRQQTLVEDIRDIASLCRCHVKYFCGYPDTSTSHCECSPCYL